MTSIGDTLRRERQRRNIDLPEIAGQLKISVRFLEAIEHDDFGKLPGGVFTKSFVRQYADLLGLDADEIAAEVGHVLEPEPALSEIPGKHKPDVPGIELQMGEESWQSVRERPAALPSWFRAGLLLVTLMLVCSGVYWWFQRPHHPVLAHEVSPPPKPAAVAQPVIPVSYTHLDVYKRQRRGNPGPVPCQYPRRQHRRLGSCSLRRRCAKTPKDRARWHCSAH